MCLGCEFHEGFVEHWTRCSYECICGCVAKLLWQSYTLSLHHQDNRLNLGQQEWQVFQTANGRVDADIVPQAFKDYVDEVKAANAQDHG